MPWGLVEGDTTSEEVKCFTKSEYAYSFSKASLQVF